MAYVIGPISGCHINPAVTLGMLLAKKITPRHAAYAVGRARCSAGSSARRSSSASPAAATAGSAAAFASNGWDRDGFSGLGAAIIVEIVFTALFVFVVLTTTGRRFAPGFGGLVAGITLAVIHLVTIPVDNTSVNPARSLATAIFADTDPSALGQLWAFIVFPLIGSVVGVFVWLLVDEATLESTMLDTDMLRDDPRRPRRRHRLRRGCASRHPTCVTRRGRRRRQTGVTTAMATADDVETYRRHAGELIRYATVLVGPDDAADVVSDAVLAAFATRRLARRDQPAGLPLPGRAAPQRVAPPHARHGGDGGRRRSPRLRRRSPPSRRRRPSTPTGPWRRSASSSAPSSS